MAKNSAKAAKTDTQPTQDATIEANASEEQVQFEMDEDGEAVEANPGDDSSNKAERKGASAKKALAKNATEKSDRLKTKIQLDESIETPFSKLQLELKRLGVKNANFGEVISEALKQVPAEWWEEKTEKLIPLEIKVQQALEDPDMRKKLSSLLADRPQ